MLKVKIIDVVNNTVLEELLFAYDHIADEVVSNIKPVINKFTDNKITVEVELAENSCCTYQDKNMIAAKILRRINSVNPYNKD